MLVQPLGGLQHSLHRAHLDEAVARRPTLERRGGFDSAAALRHRGLLASCFVFAMYLLVENHVHAVWFDVLRKLAQEGEDVFNAGRVWQPPQPQAVPDAARRGQERHGGQH